MRRHPIDYRSHEVRRVMQSWRTSESCSLVGVGSVGKSNLLQHLLNEEVQAHYLSEDQLTQFKAINVDPNMLGPLPSGEQNDAVRAWAGYELMMHRLYLTFYPFDVLPVEEAKQFYATYQALQDGTNPLYAYMGLRYFELGLEFFLRRGYRMVFMFDEFEELVRQLPVKFFQTLRGLRDQHKSQLSYLTFTRAPLEVVAQRHGVDALDFEPFKELFTDNVVYVGPYGEKDARRMVREVAGRMDLSMPASLIELVLSASGGFAGLLRAVLHEVAEIAGANSEESEADLMARLSRKVSVRSECRTIWDSLSGAEQNLLLAIVRVAPYSLDGETEQAIATLLHKRLVRFDRDAQVLKVEPALFRGFVVDYV